MWPYYTKNANVARRWCAIKPEIFTYIPFLFLVPVGSAVAIILFIGIVTLVVWKILVDLHDKREYRKFAEEAASNGFDVAENPIYRPPAVNINNPAYCGRT